MESADAKPAGVKPEDVRRPECVHVGPRSSDPCHSRSAVLVNVRFPSVDLRLQEGEEVTPGLTVLEPREKQIFLELVDSEKGDEATLAVVAGLGRRASLPGAYVVAHARL